MGATGGGTGFLDGGGAASDLIRARDWSGHPLGPPQAWPSALKTNLSLVLNSPESMILAWFGPDRLLYFFFNETYFPLLGPRLAWAMGERFDRVWADAWTQAEPLIEAALAGRPQRFTDLPWRLDTDRGAADTFWSFSYSRVLDEAGAPAGVFIFTNETTGRVLADAALKESQESLRREAETQRRNLQQMPGFVGLLSGPGHVFTYVNDAYVKVGGPRDYLGRTVRQVFPELEGQGYYELLDQVYATGEPFITHAMPIQLSGDDERRFLDFVYQPIRDDAGEVSGVFVGGYDATEAVRAQEALRELNSTLEARVQQALAERKVMADLVEGADAFVMVLAPDHRVVAVNRAAVEACGTILGVRPEVGDDLLALLADQPEARDRLRALWSRALAGETYVEVQRFGAGPSPRAYEIHFSPLRDEEGRLIGAYQFAYDVTERLREQEQLAQVEETLRQSQKMEAVGQLTGGLAHDFNNLLAGVSGSLELMQARVDQGRISELGRYLGAAQGAARRAAALTHRLLAFSRRQTLDPRPTNVNALVAGMEELIRRTVGPAVEVEVVGAAGLWPTLVDPPQLENALLNLCINARDAMPSGGRITVETANTRLDAQASRRHELPEGRYVSLCVTDTGSGMTPEVVAKAFDPFFTTKPIGAGTGLGLSMIYGFAKQSGGQVRIYSEVGEGTTVCIYLPRHRGEAEDGEAPPAARPPPPVEQGGTVLVVDDEPTVRMLVLEVLEDLGHHAVEAADSASGLKILQSDVTLDLLITDVGLPGGMNGRQMADAGRVGRPDLKVLFITGYAENAVFGDGRLDPGVAVLTKPFAIDALSARIREMIAAP